MPTIKDKQNISKSLIYETINGKPVYYKGYEDVVEKRKQLDDIIGSSFLHSFVLSCIVKYLHFIKLEDKFQFKVLTNELGLHIDKNNELLADIAIFEHDRFKTIAINNEYCKVAPNIIFEFDTKADLTDFDHVMDYITTKTNKLFNFGVEKVYWILSKNRQIIDATPKQKWFIIDWATEIEPIDGYKFTIENLIDKEGINYK